MAQENLITSVATTKEKGLTYRETIKRFKRAMGNGFFFEALLINGALIEDRLHSYLYYLGVFAMRSHRSACAKAKKQLFEIQNQYSKPRNGLQVANASSKITLIRTTLLWYKNHDAAPTDDTYLHTLWTQYDKRIDDVDEFLDVLDRIDTWREYRNEIIHGLAGKRVSKVSELIEGQCHEGEQLFRALDAYVSKIKLHETIRKAAGLGTTRRV